MMSHRILIRWEMKTEGSALERAEGPMDAWLQWVPRWGLVRCFVQTSWRWEVVGSALGNEEVVAFLPPLGLHPALTVSLTS